MSRLDFVVQSFKAYWRMAIAPGEAVIVIDLDPAGIARLGDRVNQRRQQRLALAVDDLSIGRMREFPTQPRDNAAFGD